jgi:hypothetical protein
MKLVNAPQHTIHIGALAWHYISMNGKAKGMINQACVAQAQCARTARRHAFTVGVHSISKV